MNIELEPGDEITLTTANGSILVSADAEAGFTIVTITHAEGHKLTPKLNRSSEDGRQFAQVTIEPAGGL